MEGAPVHVTNSLNKIPEVLASEMLRQGVRLCVGVHTLASAKSLVKSGAARGL